MCLLPDMAEDRATIVVISLARIIEGVQRMVVVVVLPVTQHARDLASRMRIMKGEYEEAARSMGMSGPKMIAIEIETGTETETETETETMTETDGGDKHTDMSSQVLFRELTGGGIRIGETNKEYIRRASRLLGF
jgi:hypothetical protein